MQLKLLLILHVNEHIMKVGLIRIQTGNVKRQKFSILLLVICPSCKVLILLKFILCWFILYFHFILVSFFFFNRCRQNADSLVFLLKRKFVRLVGCQPITECSSSRLIVGAFPIMYTVGGRIRRRERGLANSHKLSKVRNERSRLHFVILLVFLSQKLCTSANEKIAYFMMITLSSLS